ncbi:hypothetical protein, partial [Burkholderia vietnamiensis]|uniref:hypothetical protein n=1 Tax=Burkholderia vietnamiensis TaxID=60552 RepID=UPI001CC63A16
KKSRRSGIGCCSGCGAGTSIGGAGFQKVGEGSAAFATEAGFLMLTSWDGGVISSPSIGYQFAKQRKSSFCSESGVFFVF